MRLLIFLILFLLTYSIASAQENPAPGFICLYNGRILMPNLKTKPENKQHVKEIIILHPYTHIKNEVTHYDTSIIYKRWHAPNGEEITIENNFYSEFKGFSNLSFNKDGSIGSKTFETRGIRGCGNYHWNVGGVVQYNYEYKKGRCIKITTGDGSYTAITYNNDGLKTSSNKYYYTVDSGKKILNADEYSYQYRYDKKGRLSEEYEIYNLQDTQSASIQGLPPDMLHILLRQTPELTNEYLIKEFGITEDSLYVYRADLPEAYVKQIDDRDSADYEMIERYKYMTRYFTGYVYNEKGLLGKRYILDEDELLQVETFTYDDKNRLIKWDSLDDFDVWNNWDKGRQTTWTFEYNNNDQPIHCRQQEFTREYQSNFSQLKEKPALKLNETNTHTFTYNNKGSVTEMRKTFKNSYRDDTSNYLIRYEYYK